MPLPMKKRAKFPQSSAASRAALRADSIDWVGFWSVSFGLAAISVAAIVFFAGQDRVGAAFIMIAAAAIVAVMMSASVLVEE